MIIKTEKLFKIYDTGAIQVTALKGIDLGIEKNEYAAIMGASGSGKSTLMNILGCLDRLSEGKYILDGVDVSSMDDLELAHIRNKKIGFVFQAFNLLPKMSALENVMLPMVYARVPAGERHKKAVIALEKVGLKERMHHRPNELSGGQKQRVAIARALVNEPAIILADEPTGNLDSQSSEEIMTIFEHLNREGATVVMVTHEPDIAAHTKRVITFRDGNIISDRMNENRTIAEGGM